MAGQEGRSGGALSPLGPDSTWGEGELLNSSRMEEMLAQLESKILRDQDEKFNQLLEEIRMSKAKNSEDDLKNCCIDRVAPLVQSMEDVKNKLDLLLGGENEANKLIDSIVPNVEKVQESVSKLEKKIVKEMVNIEVVKETVKKINDYSKDIKQIKKDTTETYYNSKKLREDLNRVEDFVKNKITDKKRHKSGSESSDNGSRNRRSRSPESSRKRKTSREPSLASIASKKEAELEKLLMQINQSLELQRDTIEKQNSIPVLESQIIPNLFTIRKLVETANRPPGASKWDNEGDDLSPSPLHKHKDGNKSPPHKLAKKLGVGAMKAKSKEDLSGKGSKKKKKKLKEKSSDGSSSDSSSDDNNTGSKKKRRKTDLKDMDEDLMVFMKAVSSMVTGQEEKVKEMSKLLKKSQPKIEENCKQVLDRVGEMTVGVQVIAENLDSVNDVAKKIEVLDEFQAQVLPRLEKLDKLDRIEDCMGQMEITLGLVEQRINRNQEGSEGWQKDSLRMGVVDETVKHLEVNMDRKLCEFGSLFEELTNKINRKVDKLSQSEVGVEPAKFKRFESTLVTLADNTHKMGDTLKRMDKRGGGTPSPIVGDLYGPLMPLPASLDDLTLTPPGGGGVSDRLSKQLEEISPLLENIFIRVLPTLQDIRQSQKKEADKDKLAIKELREHGEKVEKIMDMVEDLKEARNISPLGQVKVRSNLDTRIQNLDNENTLVRLDKLEERMSRKSDSILNALSEMRTFTAKQMTLDRVEKLLIHEGDEGKGGLGDSARLEKHLKTALEFLKKEEKTLDMFMKNSMSDAKLLSQCNTAIQGMKAAVSGNGKETLLAVQGVGDQVRQVELAMGAVGQDVGALGGSLDEIGSQVRSIDRESLACSGMEGLAKVQTGLDRLALTVRGLEKIGGVKVGSAEDSGKAVDVGTVSQVGIPGNYSDLKNQLDALYDLVSTTEESLNNGMQNVKSDLNKHDKNIGLAVNNFVKLLKSSVENTKILSTELSETEKRLKSSLKTGCENLTSEFSDRVEASSEKMSSRINDSLEGTLLSLRDAGGSKESSPDITTKVDTVLNRMDSVLSKQDKIGKIVARVKYLVEDQSDDEGEGGSKLNKRKGSLEPFERNQQSSDIEKQILDHIRRFDFASVDKKIDIIIDGLQKDPQERKFDEFIIKLDALEDTITRKIEEELCGNNSAMSESIQVSQDVRNIVREIGDRMLTNKSWETMVEKLEFIKTGITSIPDEFGSQAAALEENLCVNVVGSVRDVFKENWEDLMNEMEQVMGKLTTIKKHIKYGVKDGSGEEADGATSGQTSLDTVMENINIVTEKLTSVQSALENEAVEGDGGGGTREKLSTALLLTEIRKKADQESVAKLSQEMFKAVHNVQKRLLEEQVRLLTRLGENRVDSPQQPQIISLIENLNKVRECQKNILTGQDSALSVQTQTNHLLSLSVDKLEQVHRLVDDGELAGQMTGRLAELCDELAGAVTGLISLQDQLLQSKDGSDNMDQLTGLIRSASVILRESGSKKRPAEEAGLGRKRAGKFVKGVRREPGEANITLIDGEGTRGRTRQNRREVPASTQSVSEEIVTPEKSGETPI